MDNNTRTPRLKAGRVVAVGWALALVAVLATVFAAVEKSAHPPASPNWRTNLSAARNEAKASGKLILVDVGANWCPPCRQMDRETWSDASVIEQTSNLVTVRLDADADASDVKALGVGVLPTVLIFSQRGEPLVRKSGFISAGELRALLESAKKDGASKEAPSVSPEGR